MEKSSPVLERSIADYERRSLKRQKTETTEQSKQEKEGLAGSAINNHNHSGPCGFPLFCH
jgi:hypothetical protein